MHLSVCGYRWDMAKERCDMSSNMETVTFWQQRSKNWKTAIFQAVTKGTFLVDLITNDWHPIVWCEFFLCNIWRRETLFVRFLLHAWLTVISMLKVLFCIYFLSSSLRFYSLLKANHETSASKSVCDRLRPFSTYCIEFSISCPPYPSRQTRHTRVKLHRKQANSHTKIIIIWKNI